MTSTVLRRCGAALLLALAGSSGFETIPSPGSAASAQQVSGPEALERGVRLSVEQTFDRLATREIQRSPQWASRIDLSRFGLTGAPDDELDDRSPAALDRARLDWIEGLAELEALPAEARATRDVRIALYSYTHLVELAGFGYGHVELGLARPYSIDHMRGGWLDLVDLLGERHRIHRERDLAIWLSRLEQVPEKLEEDLRRLRFDAENGVVPPAPILDLILVTSAPLAAEEIESHPLLVLLDRQLAGASGIDGGRKAQARARAVRLLREEIVPAYRDFRAGIEALKPAAGPGPGVWALPDGERFYNSLIGFYATDQLDADALYAEGEAEVLAIEAELDAALKAQGLIESSVGERLAALSAQADQLYTDDEAGRAELLAALRADLEAARALSNDILPREVSAPIAVLPVPEYLAASAPSAYYRAGSIDGSRPGLLYINLRSTAEWPAYTLPTLMFHEGLPGHHADSAYPRERRRVPLVNRMVWMSAYTEGWATYAEDLADEAGLYAEDPLARIGYMQSMLFRAARLVVDTGLHARGWSREQAVDYLVEKTGLPRSMMEAEVDRYIVWPGQALTYLTGRNTIRTLRVQARAALGEDFDLAAFHGVILEAGPRPLDLVEEDVYAWISREVAKRQAR